MIRITLDRGDEIIYDSLMLVTYHDTTDLELRPVTYYTVSGTLKPGQTLAADVQACISNGFPCEGQTTIRTIEFLP
jgi:hypothetical protein